jgi:hypothetical protein
MWGEYMLFYRELLTTAGKEETAHDDEMDLKARLISVYEAAETHSHVDESHYIYWASLVTGYDALRVLKRGIQTYPQSTALWLKNIEYCTHKNRKQHVFDEAMASVREAELWPIRKCYIGWLIDSQSTPHEKIASEFLMAIADNVYGSEAMLMYLDWEYKRTGLVGARRLCLEFPKDRVTAEVLEALTQFEMKEPQPADRERIRPLFEMALQKDERCDRLWLSYISWELEMKEFERAQHLYWKALKCVADPEAFATHYRHVL